MEKIEKYFSDCIFTMKGSKMKKNYFETFFWGHPFCLHAKFQVSYSTPSRFHKKNWHIFVLYLQKNIFLQNIYGVTPAQKISSKFDQKWANASQFKRKTFFCLLTLLTYSALEKNRTNVKSVSFHPQQKTIWSHIWKYIMEKI